MSGDGRSDGPEKEIINMPAGSSYDEMAVSTVWYVVVFSLFASIFVYLLIVVLDIGNLK